MRTSKTDLKWWSESNGSVRPPELIELTQLRSTWVKVYNEKLPLIKRHHLSDAVVLDYQINSIHVSFCPILLWNNRQHNSQRVPIHVHGGASRAYWGVFTNPLSPHVVPLRSRLCTQPTRGGTQSAWLHMHSPESLGAAISYKWGSLHAYLIPPL